MLPPIGRGIIPLAVEFASPVHTTATLLLIQALLIIPITCFRILAASILFFDSRKNLVIFAIRSFMSVFDSIRSATCSATVS